MALIVLVVIWLSLLAGWMVAGYRLWQRVGFSPAQIKQHRLRDKAKLLLFWPALAIEIDRAQKRKNK